MFIIVDLYRGFHFLAYPIQPMLNRIVLLLLLSIFRFLKFSALYFHLLSKSIFKIEYPQERERAFYGPSTLFLSSSITLSSPLYPHRVFILLSCHCYERFFCLSCLFSQPPARLPHTPYRLSLLLRLHLLPLSPLPLSQLSLHSASSS